MFYFILLKKNNKIEKNKINKNEIEKKLYC